MGTPIGNETGRLPGIELVRFGAALAVLLAHYNHFFIRGYEYVDYAYFRQPLFWLFEPFYHYGTRAVEVFWCLSGFIFFYRYGDLVEKRLSAQKFFWLRFSRLYPLHFATLIMVAILQAFYHRKFGRFFVVEINDVKHFVLNLFFASNWGLQNGFSFNAPVWSVSLEVLVYGLFFAASYWVGSGLLITGLVLFGCLAFGHFNTPENVFVRCVFFFYLGGFGCRWFGWARKSSGWRKASPIAALGLVGIAGYQFSRAGNLDWILIQGVPAALVVLAFSSPLLPGWAARIAERLGNLTYASYLIHFPFQILVMTIAGYAGIPVGFAYSPIFLWVYLVGVFSLAYFIFVNFEMPCQQQIRNLFLVT